MAHILVVEDNPQNLTLATVILRSAGHVVVGAQDADDAERALAGGLPQLIVMDLALPGKDGYTLVRELRRRPGTDRIPILAVSSFAMPGDAERAIAAGCSAYLTKPIRRLLLLERVTQLLAGADPAPAQVGVPPPAEPPAAAPVPAPPTNEAPTPAVAPEPARTVPPPVGST
jgi:CheY-like chemotaxis protein